MTLTLDLTPDLEERLNAEAARLGLTPSEYAIQVLQKETPAAPMPTTGAELVAYWEREGIIGIWADRTDIPDSPEYARELRRRAETRVRD
jgi:hypothetical protein